jgi:ribosomal protein L11 methyltransferase
MRRTTVTVPVDRADEALDVLLPALPAGVFEERGEATARIAWLGDLPDGLDLGGLALETEHDEVPDEPAQRVAARAPGFLIAGRVLVRAPAHPPAPDGVLDVVIEAEGGAFGTGTHPTTRQCVELLLEIGARGSLADLGCGSGALAILAAKLGHGPVYAIDIEVRSVRSAMANAAANGVEVHAVQLDLMHAAPPPTRALAANVPLAVHRTLAGHMPPEVETVLVSGIVETQIDEALALYGARDFTERGRRHADGWASLHLDRDAGW